MKFPTARRPLSVALAPLLAAGAIALGTGGARADTLGTMEVTPGAGTDSSGAPGHPITLTVTAKRAGHAAVPATSTARRIG
ncbi:hypothetical protein [Streptomyces sp. NPDC001970]